MDEFSFPFVATAEDSLFQPPFPHFFSFPSPKKALDRNVRTLEDAGRDEEMDLLWEIFNEELVWISYDKIEMTVEKMKGEETPVYPAKLCVNESESDVQTDDVAAEACSLRKTKILRRRGMMIRRRGRNLLKKFLSGRKYQPAA